MKDMSLKYIVRESNLSMLEKLVMSDFNRVADKRTSNEKLEAFAIYIRLLMAMADNKESGFFLYVGKKDIALLAEEFWGVDVGLVQDVIDSCVEHEIFDKEYYTKYKIITSQNIQEKYFYSHNVRRRVKEDLIKYRAYVYPNIWKKLNLKSIDNEKNNSQKVVDKNGKVVDRNGKLVDENDKVVDRNEEIVYNFEQTKQNKTKQNETKLNQTERETKQDAPPGFSCRPNLNSPSELVDLSGEQKLSLTRFLKKFPNKSCELNFKVPKNLDINELIKKVSESAFLSCANNLNVKWCCEHYDEISSGAYSDFQRLKAPSQRNYQDRDYTGFDFDSLFTDLEEVKI